jgi:hypothetical protein
MKKKSAAKERTASGNGAGSGTGDIEGASPKLGFQPAKVQPSHEPGVMNRESMPTSAYFHKPAASGSSTSEPPAT